MAQATDNQQSCITRTAEEEWAWAGADMEGAVWEWEEADEEWAAWEVWAVVWVWEEGEDTEVVEWGGEEDVRRSLYA